MCRQSSLLRQTTRRDGLVCNCCLCDRCGGSFLVQIRSLCSLSIGDPWQFSSVMTAKALLNALGAAVTLGMLATRLGDTSKGSRGDFTRIVRKGDITKGNNADQSLVTIDHREASHLDVGHARSDLIKLLIVEAVTEVETHDLAHLLVRTFTFSHGSNGDVAVGNDPNKPVIFADWNSASINRSHELGHLANRLIWSGDLDVTRHCFSDLHQAISIRLSQPPHRALHRAPEKACCRNVSGGRRFHQRQSCSGKGLIVDLLNKARAYGGVCRAYSRFVGVWPPISSSNRSEQWMPSARSA